MSKPYLRPKTLSDAYAVLRHPVWAWLHVYGDELGGWGPPQPREKKKATRAAGTPNAAPSDTARPSAAVPAEDAAATPLSFAEIEARAYRAFADKGVRDRLDGMKLAPPDPPGSGPLAALLADLETARLGALRAGDWREARAAVMDKAKLCAMTIAATPEKDVPPDDRPTDVVIDEAFEALGAWRERRDAIIAAVRADRERDVARTDGGTAISPLQPAAPLP